MGISGGVTGREIVKLRSIRRLERPTNLRKLCVRGCSVLEELEGVEHTAKRLDVSK